MNGSSTVAERRGAGLRRIFELVVRREDREVAHFWSWMPRFSAPRSNSWLATIIASTPIAPSARISASPE